MLAASEKTDMTEDPVVAVTADFDLVCRAHSLYKRLVNQRMLSELGVSLSQGSALLLLAQSPEVSFQGLAQLLGCGTSRISRLIHELEKRGLIKSWRSHTDRRALQLALTPDGAALACRVPAALHDTERQMMRVFTRPECRRLREFLARIIADVDRFCGMGESTQGD